MVALGRHELPPDEREDAHENLDREIQDPPNEVSRHRDRARDPKTCEQLNENGVGWPESTRYRYERADA